MSIENKIKRLEDYLKDKRCVLGFSAGSDSTLLAYILSRVSKDSLLVTIDNNMMPQEFIDYTKQKAREMNLEHKVIKLNFLEEDLFLNNVKERCFECRKRMYDNIRQLPEFEEYDYFIEGTNITDLLEDRPGVLVREMFNMTSPLVECNITKRDVFDIINHFNLEYSNDTTCLATRIKTNQEVSPERLKLIYDSERLVKSHVKQENVRVRYDNQTAAISVDNPLELLDEKLIYTLRTQLQKLGYKKVFLDITGYEKTRLEASVDEDGQYYYRLPYDINLEKTRAKLERKEPDKTALSDNLIFDDITIEENGKISMPPTDDFVEKFNNVLSCVERKSI